VLCLEKSYNKYFSELPADRKDRNFKRLNKLPHCCSKLMGCYPPAFRKLP